MAHALVFPEAEVVAMVNLTAAIDSHDVFPKLNPPIDCDD